jgi:hypothetical protein
MEPIMRTLILLSLLLAGCGGGDSTGPSYPPIAGTYSAIFGVSFSNSLETVSSNEPGTVTLQSPTSNGAFTGSYVITGSGSGTIAGTVRVDGGISISQFGDPNADPLESLQLLQNTFYWCNFALAAGAPMSGSVSGNALQLSGGISVPCSYVNPTQTVPSTISVTVTATR